MNSKKSRRLLEEAEKDIGMGYTNKAASALYFSVRKEVESVLLSVVPRMPRRDNKLANVLRHMGYVKESEAFLQLYVTKEEGGLFGTRRGERGAK
jgi:hypothetical protein